MSWLWGHRVRPQPLLTCAASCGERGGLSGRKPARRGGTGTAGALCACGSGGSAHRSGQISSHILPRCSGRASRLQRRGDVSGLVDSHPPYASVLPYPALPIQEGFPDPHCAPPPAQLSHSVPHFSAPPQVQRSVLWASLPHYSTPPSLEIVGGPLLIPAVGWHHVPCPSSARGSHHTNPQSASLFCLSLAQVEGFSMSPTPTASGTPGPPKPATGGATRVVSLHALVPTCAPAQPHHGGPSEHFGGHPHCPLPYTQNASTRPHADYGLSLGALTQPHHGDPPYTP